MTPGPAHPTRESAFVAILLFPMRAVERARGWRRSGLLGLYGLLALLAWGFLWRETQLAGLPDIGEPFDVAASRRRIPDDRNAFVPYLQAAGRFRDASSAESQGFSKANLKWPVADDLLKGWVSENREAITLLRAGSERPGAYLEIPPGTPHHLEASAKVEVVRKLSWIGTAALFEAGRLRSVGDLDGAWSLLKAVVRATRHIERAVPTIQSRGFAMTLAQYAREPVADWASDPAVEIAQLRRALDDLAAAEALTPPVSLSYQAEYLAARDVLSENLEPIIQARAALRRQDFPFHPFAIAPGLEAFLRREPERSRRILRILVANDLAWCDRPAMERPGLAVPRLHLYDSDPTAPLATRILPPAELERWAGTALVDATPSWRRGDIEMWDKSDRRSMGELKQAVVVPLFAREMGRAPASPAEALRRYFPISGDSPGRDEVEPISDRAVQGSAR